MKTLKVTFQKDCIGCELCVFETQRQLKKVGLEGALIRIKRDSTDGTKEFYVELDPNVNKLDVEKISAICPKKVFEVSEESVEESSF